uniref:ORF55 n=1 Tax=Saccharolobus islandicus TaxID=43080 RepID=Q9C4X8_SACIS|nr:ORF55 [Sulfolobus islandicus]
MVPEVLDRSTGPSMVLRRSSTDPSMILHWSSIEPGPQQHRTIYGPLDHHRTFARA